jgi:hypothetical protein
MRQNGGYISIYILKLIEADHLIELIDETVKKLIAS